MKKIKKIGIISCAKVCALVMTIIGFLAGIFAAFFSLGPCHTTDNISCLIQLCPFHSEMGFWAIIIFPVSYAIMGFVAGLLGAYIYNLVAGWVGGIEIELEDVKDKVKTE